MGAVIVSEVPAPYSRSTGRNEENMAGEIAVSGQLRDDVDPLQESLMEFRKHHQNAGDQLNNLAAGLKHTDSVPVYIRQEWPMMVYHANGGEKIVHNEGELVAAQTKGFRATPYPKAQVHVGNPLEEKALLLKQLDEERARNTVQAEQLAKLAERLEALEVSKTKPTKAA